MLRRRIRADVASSNGRDPRPRCPGGGSDHLDGLRFVRFLQNSVEVDGSAGPDRADGVRQEVERGVRQVQDDAVHRRDLAEDCPRVALPDDHASRTVRCDVRPQEFDGGRVRVRGVDGARPSSLRNQDGVRTNAGEWVRDDFAPHDEVRDPLSFRRESGTEVGLREVDMVTEAVFHVDGGRPRLPSDGLDLPHPTFPANPMVLHGHTNLRIPLEDRPADCRPMGPEFLRDLEDGNVSDDVKGGRQISSESRWDFHKFLVTSNCDETLLEVALFDRESQVGSRCDRKEHAVAVLRNAQPLQEHAARHELSADFLRPRSGHKDTPRAHVAPMPPMVVKGFRAAANLHGAAAASLRRMGELVFIGLGLHDEKDITLRGLEEARAADVVYAELYTSGLAGTSLASIERLVGQPIRKLTRGDIEDGRTILEAASRQKVAFLVVGDPMAATTHVDLRLRASSAKIPTRIVHGVSILTAAAGALGLQGYKFGRTTTIPFATPGFEPTSPLEAVLANLRAGLHSLLLLDLREDGTFLTPLEAIESLLRMAASVGTAEFGPKTFACVLGRVGSPDVRIQSGPIGSLGSRDLGPPLHCLVIPAALHFLEKESLIAFGGAPHDL